MRNLRGRLTLGVLAVLAVVLAIAGVLVARDVDRTNRQALDDRLRRTAELSQATALAAVEEELPDVDRRLDAVLRATKSSLRLAIGRTVLLDSGEPLDLPLRAAPGLRTVTIDGQRQRVLTTTLREESLGGLVWLQVASSLEEVEDRQAALRERLALLGLLMLLVAGAGTWLAADLVLRPLRRLRAATTAVAGEGDLERHVPVGGAAEIRSLAESFNAMLARLSRSADDRNRALQATRRFAADAGHELRTPLTSVQASLETIARHPEMDDDRRTGLARDALAEQRRLVHLLDGLQALARGDAEPGAPAPVDLADLVETGAGAARARHPEARIETACPEAETTLVGWEPGLRAIVDNLVENAVVHGGATVRVTLGQPADGAGALLAVDDDGPGIPAAERERVLQPFARLNGTAGPGSGLGLALVAQQAHLHGATVAVGDSDLGGARVAVRFPAGATRA